MDPITIALLVAKLGPVAMQFFQGRKQGKMADELAPKSDPIYDIPKSATDALRNAEANASSRYLSGQTNLENRLDQGTANATSDVLRTAKSPQDALAALTAITSNNQGNESNIAFQAAQDYQGRQGDLRGQQGIMAGLENAKWNNDVLNKFLRDSAASSALRNAAMRDKYEAVKGVSNAVGLAAQSGGRMFTETPEAMSSTTTGERLSLPQATPQLNTTAPNLFGNNQFSPQGLGITPEQFSALSSYFNQ